MGKGRQYHRRRLHTVTYGVWGPTTGRATLAAAVAQHAGSRELARLQGWHRTRPEPGQPPAGWQQAPQSRPYPRGFPRFNEAGGFLPRKLGGSSPSGHLPTRFNEAGGFLPRKRRRWVTIASMAYPGFNEAGGFLPRKLRPNIRRRSAAPRGFNEA